VALVAALALRLLYQWQASRGPFASSVYLPIDAREYHAWAVAWLAGAWPPPEAFFRPPLYTAFLAAIYRLAGPDPPIALAVQAVLGTASCALVHAIARRLFAAPVPIVATSLCAATGTLIYFDGQLLSASLDVFLGLAIVALLLEGRTRGLGWWLAAGSVLGLSAVNRGAALLQLPLAILWIVALEAWREDGARSAARAARRALALALPVAVAIAPVALYNARYDEDGGRPAPASEVVRRVLSGRAVLIASNSGLNFFLGNHLELRDVNRLDHPGHMASYDRVRLEPTRQGLTSSAAKNAWLVRETLGHIVEAPADWLALMGLKARDLLSGEEIPRNTSIYAERRHSWLLGALLWKWGVALPSGLLIPLGVAGIALLRRSWRDHFLPWSVLLAQTVFLLAFFVTARYRLPMLPLLAVYAAHALVELARRLREPGRPRAAPLAAGMALLALVANLGIGPMAREHAYWEYHDLAVAHAERGNLEAAEDAFRHAVARQPGHSDSQLGLCKVLLDRDRAGEALEPCTRAVEADPTSAGAHFYLARTLEVAGRIAEAVPHYERAVALAPDSAIPRAALRRAREIARRQLGR
jgi:tetratricopeptide (TPR) repeat protein